MRSSLSAKELERRTIERRAVEAVFWGMPAVNFGTLRRPFVIERASWERHGIADS